MTFAFLTHEPFFPPTGGGSAEALYLVQECVRRGHQVHVFSPPVDDPAGVQARLGIVLHPFTAWRMGRYTSLRSFKYLLYPFALARVVARAASQVPFDLLLSQHSIASVAAGRLKRPLGVPIVMNLLDYLTGFMETWPAWRMPRFLLAVLKRYERSLPRRFDADAVLTVSDPLAELVADAGYPRERIRPIYYGYDADLFRFDVAAAQARLQQPPTLVMHGSLDHHHLGPIALEAVSRVRAQRPDARFRFIGHPTDAVRRFVAAARRRGLGLGIEVVGFVPYREMAAQLAGATVGLVPYEESSGVHCAFVAKVVEYLGVGLPVVCTPLAAIQRYFAGERLVRFSGFDGATFAEQILAWLTAPAEDLAHWAVAANQRVRQELDWRVVSRRAVDWVEAWVGSGAAGSGGGRP